MLYGAREQGSQPMDPMDPGESMELAADGVVAGVADDGVADD